MPFIIARDLSSEELDVPSTNDTNSTSKEALDAQQQETNCLFSWDDHKENIKPISQGRKIEDLMRSLQILDDTKSRKHLLETRKEQFDKDLELNKDDPSKQLDIWYNYIDWLEQNVPNGGKVNGITNAIEQCIEIYYDKKEFKQDKRILNIFMIFKHFCDEPIEIFGFMYANSICTLQAKFYLDWSWQYEMRKNMKRAEDLIKLGLKNLATPRDILLEAETQIKYRIERMIRSGELNDCADFTTVSSRESQMELAQSGIRAALQTLKFKVSKKKGISVPINRIGSAVDTINIGGLKSQTKMVNGVPVAKLNKKQSRQLGMGATKTKKESIKPISIYSDQVLKASSSSGSTKDENGDENSGLTRIMNKIPTSQRIQSIGRIGAENQVQSSGSIQGSSNVQFKVPLSRR